MDIVFGLVPTETHGAVVMSAGRHPVAVAGVFVSDHDPYRTVRFGDCRPGVDRHRVKPVVKRFHPQIVELEVPVEARRRGERDLQRLTGFEAPVPVPEYLVGVTPDASAHVGVDLEGVRPVHPFVDLAGEATNHTIDEQVRTGQPFGKRGRRQRRRPVVGAQSFDLQAGRFFGRPVEVELADYERAHLRLEGNPVAGMFLLAEDHLESPVVVDDQIRPTQRTHVAEAICSSAVVAGVGPEAEVVDGSPGAPQPVVVAAVDTHRLVVGVRVVAADLHLVRQGVHEREPWIASLEISLQASPHQATEETESFDTGLGVVCFGVFEHQLAGGLEGVTEVHPRLAGQDPPGHRVVARVCHEEMVARQVRLQCSRRLPRARLVVGLPRFELPTFGPPDRSTPNP
ncbi:hypothetical protein CMK17_22275 [Candidatus Poribacteria bacterium]|nr:hypothetical protein [Candidatus Poribacteria bacterium]